MQKGPYQKISFIQGPLPLDQIPLEKKSLSIGRPDHLTGWVPDIDLSPDYKVSRNHASLYYSENSWRIEDGGSSHGTMVNGAKIEGPVELQLDVPVQMGDTVWVIDPPGKVRKRWGEFWIEFRKVPVINYATYHCGIPVISDLRFRNGGLSPSTDIQLSIQVKGYSDIWRKRIDALPAGGEVSMGDIHLSLNYEKLEGNEEKKRTELKVKVNGEVLFTDGIDILGFYQWPTDPAFSKSLACFIQPSHPLVNNITLDAHTCLEGVDHVMSFTRLLKTDREDRVDLVLKAIYDCLVAKYQIRYLPPPQSLEVDYQVVRPPHRVINDSRQRRGGGTCIDMALLFASCLENLQLQPLIIFIKEEGSIQHAFVGCWRLITERFEPVLRDPEKMKKALASDPRQKLIVVETTGVTDRFQERLGFEDAVKKAEEQLQTKEFLFALDVSAIRQTVVPLQFPMSPKAITIIRKAEELARSEKNKRLETKHLVHSLLLNRERINGVLEQAKVDSEKIKPALQTSTSMIESIDEVLPSPTINYRRVIEDARLTASDTGLTYVDELRLWYAVLLSQSESVDRILEDIGTTRKNLKSIFDHHYAWTGDVVQTFYEL